MSRRLLTENTPRKILVAKENPSARAALVSNWSLTFSSLHISPASIKGLYMSRRRLIILVANDFLKKPLRSVGTFSMGNIIHPVIAAPQGIPISMGSPSRTSSRMTSHSSLN
jgi:hypothetical protein